VEDPEGYHPELLSDVRTEDGKLDLWLVSGAERFRRDPELKHALLTLAQHEDSRRCLLLLDAIMATPGLVNRLLEVLRAEGAELTGSPVEGNSSGTPRNGKQGRKERKS
jgi:hypothetical protein